MIVDRLTQSWNACLPIEVTELGIIMEVKPVHPQNVPRMEVTEFGIEIVVSLEQFWKVFASSVIVLGRDADVKLVHP